MNTFLSIAPRLLADLFLAGAVFFLPWWAAVALGAALAFFFRNFYEFLAAALAIDLLYGSPAARAYGIPFFASLVSAALYLSVARVKAHLLIYR